MGAFRCLVCSINFPQDVGTKTCPACNEDLTWRAASEPHTNWRGIVAERVEADCFEVSQETWWRAEMLRKVGVDMVLALSWAEHETTFDVHDFCDRYKAMIAKGCSHENAILILTPDVVQLRGAKKV